MHPILSLLSACEGFRRLTRWIESTEHHRFPVRDSCPDGIIHGVCRSARGYCVASLLAHTRRSALVLTSDQDATDQLSVELQTLLSLEAIPDFTLRILTLPPHDYVFETTSPPDPRVVEDRLTVLHAWHRGEPAVVIGPVNALAGFTVPLPHFHSATFTLQRGGQTHLYELVQRLSDGGYRRVDTVEQVSEFSVRGGIIDIFPPTLDNPVRVELCDDEIVALRAFDPDTQLSLYDVESCDISPPREMVLSASLIADAIPRIHSDLQKQAHCFVSSGRWKEKERLQESVASDLARMETLSYFPGVERYLPWIYPQGPRLLDFIPTNTLVILEDLSRLRLSWERSREEFCDFLHHKVETGFLLPPRIPWFMHFDEIVSKLGGMTTFNIVPDIPGSGANCFGGAGEPFVIESRSLPGFQGQMARLAEKIRQWQSEGQGIICSTRHSQRLLELFHDTGIAGAKVENPCTSSPTRKRRHFRPGEITLASYGVTAGFELPEINLILLTDTEIFGWSGVHRKWRRRREGSVAVRSHLELNNGDYVVHIDHGIGVYRGITRQRVGESEKEYLLVEYAGSDRLYVPVHQIDRIHRYIGTDGASPMLNSLSGNAWEMAKRRARAAAKDIAQDLARLYALRATASGFACGPDTPWQRELEASFEWEETPDQANAIEAVKADMESTKPMDRLICGDVGYGKTEVAVRAAFKSVQENKQVAVLVPTTILAQQHYYTFRQRMAPYPVNIELLSRFRTKSEQDRVTAAIRRGSVDIVIGTHRLLSKDVAFRDLGLVIVDEEHRFGVEQKERLKQLRTEVDVLTLTATPIPRTMHMALGGIRDMSMINDPPQGRLPVRTHVTHFDDELVRTAILREMERGGQVYFVHNRVRSIRHIAAHVARLVPTARIAIGHGQLPEDDLEEIMLDFYGGKYDVLVCTTIIESGLDIPNVNTLIVDRCEQMGLAQLYQLRGRVGRSARQAYAYFLYGRRGRIGYAAEKRIEALQEFSALGSGFKIALRDLEIRGAGNLLGAEQHGMMHAVGFELYCEMLANAVREIRHEPPKRHTHLPEVDLPIAAYLPEGYIPNFNHRLDIYRRLATVEGIRDIADLETEMRDRFGPIPVPVSNLLCVMRIRVTCPVAAIRRITNTNRQLILHFAPHRQPSQAECLRLYRTLGERHSRDTLRSISACPEGLSVTLSGLRNQQALHLIADLVNTIATWRSACFG